MLSYINSDLIRQSHSYEADYRREYRPSPQNEQYILDYVTILCISIDTYVVSTLVSLIYFPEYVSKFQNAALLLLFALYAGRQFGEFLWQLSQHREFVNSKKQFTIRAWENPNMEHICELVWKNPDSVLDFRTVPVRIGQRYIHEPVIISRPVMETPAAVPTRVEPTQVRTYNTRSQARIRRAVPVA